MKPSARVQASVEILERDQATRVPLDTCVGDYMRSRRYIGSKDRAEIAQRVYDMARAHARLGWWIARLELQDTPRLRVMLWMALGEGASSKRIDDLFDGTQYAPVPLNNSEKEVLSKVEGQDLAHADMSEAVVFECPPQHEERLRAVFGDSFGRQMGAMLAPATLDVRVNIFLIDRENAQNSLAKDGVETEATPLSPWGLRCADKAYLSKTKAMNKGWIDIQDEGSQMIAYLCGAFAGAQVLDYCAGGGGKTLALGAAMQRKGRIVAMDTDAQRLEKGKQRYRKAQLADIIEVRPLSDDRHRKWLKRQKGTFDIVLTDVPCTGSGTWRRNPDMRWRNIGPSLEDLMPVQAEILDRVAPVVKEGGRLIYATCSLFREENETQVEAFLARHNDFEVMPIDEKLGIGSPFMRLTPMQNQTDGFFAAVLVKKKALD